MREDVGTGELIFLSAPYSHGDPAVKNQRYETVCEVAATLSRMGKHSVSPLICGIAITKTKHGVPDTWEYWDEFCKILLSRCSKVYVIEMDGTFESTGVDAEIKYAIEFGIPVFVVDINLNVLREL